MNHFILNNLVWGEILQKKLWLNVRTCGWVKQDSNYDLTLWSHAMRFFACFSIFILMKKWNLRAMDKFRGVEALAFRQAACTTKFVITRSQRNVEFVCIMKVQASRAKKRFGMMQTEWEARPKSASQKGSNRNNKQKPEVTNDQSLASPTKKWLTQI